MKSTLSNGPRKRGRNLHSILLGFCAGTMLVPCVAGAQSFTIEPDNYAEATVLDRILSVVHLTSAGADNQPIPPVPFEVTANDDNLDFVSTGKMVFGHANVPFWNSDRRLRMEFAAPASWVMIDFVGGQYFAVETGRLDGYNAAGQLVASYSTAPLDPGHQETMVISRDENDIVLAVAYVPPDLGVFGRLDNLRFGMNSRPLLKVSMVEGIALLQFAGATNLTYRVWSSEDLSQWSVAGAATQVQPGVFKWADLNVGGSERRFYRVSSP